MLTVHTGSLAGTHVVAAAIAGLATGGDLIVLAGEMGAGKTAFAQGFGSALGVTEPITSPTFTLVHSYRSSRDSGRIELHHADLYRLDRTLEIADLALGELLESNGIVLVEWGDVLGNSLGDHLLVRLAIVDPDVAGDPDDAGVRDLAEDSAQDREEIGSTARMITIQPIGSSWARRWGSLEAALSEVSPC